MIGLALSGAALAADVWVGGGGDVRVGYDGEDPALAGQVEADLRVTSELVFVRLDLDIDRAIGLRGGVWDGGYWWNRSEWDETGKYRGLSVPFEWAMVQVGKPGGPYIKAGVVNPPIALEDWDFHINYLPTYSAVFATTNGRVLGSEAGWMLQDETQIFAFGGYDMDFGAPIVGAGVFTEQDAYSIWAGIAALPTIDYYAAFPSFEVYPGSAVTLSVDPAFGVTEGDPFFAGQIIAQFLPESPVVPVVRVEGVANGPAIGTAEMAAQSVGVNFWPHDWVKIGLEGRIVEQRKDAGGGVVPSAVLAVSVFRPEDDGEDEETP